MNGVAAKISEKVGMFFQHGDLDAGSREQKTEHHPGGSATRYTTSHRALSHIHTYCGCICGRAGEPLSPEEVLTSVYRKLCREAAGSILDVCRVPSRQT